MARRTQLLVVFALGIAGLVPANARASPQDGLWAGRHGLRQVSFVVRGGVLTELVVSCDDDPGNLDTAHRYRIGADGLIDPAGGGPPFRGRLGTGTGEIVLARQAAGCESDDAGSLVVKALHPPRAHDGVYHAEGVLGDPLVATRYDITFRIDGGGAVVRDLGGRVDAPDPQPGSQAPFPVCTTIYDSLPDRAMTLLDYPDATELSFGSHEPGNGPFVVGGTTDATSQPIPPDHIQVAFGACGAGLGVFTASLATPEEPPGQPITGGAAVKCVDAHSSKHVSRPARTPLAHTHAHNDYKHLHPLFDALSHRFLSVEADVWLTADGQLTVGHDATARRFPRCTLDALYLDPLEELVQAHGGHVYAGSTARLQLLVDIKTQPAGTYIALDRLLRDRYASMLTSWSGGVEHPGAIRVIVSGAVSRDVETHAFMKRQPQRYSAYDGTLSDFGNGPDPALVPLVSEQWANVPHDRAHLRELVIRAHARNRQVRFWDTPDPGRPFVPLYRLVWRRELNAGVDWLNTDDLGKLEDFLK
jgi:glycerophosphoryl diester phosphodiesterase